MLHPNLYIKYESTDKPKLVLTNKKLYLNDKVIVDTKENRIRLQKLIKCSGSRYPVEVKDYNEEGYIYIQNDILKISIPLGIITLQG